MGDSGSLSHDVEIGAEALWNYLSAHTNWKTLLDWIRGMACGMKSYHNNPSLYVGERFAVHQGHVVLPKLTSSIFSQLSSCHKVVREMILEELTRSVQLLTSIPSSVVCQF